MRILLRLLGVELLSRLARRLPGRLAWWASGVVLVAVNLLPVVAVLRGAAGMGDVFLVYWIENVVVWATTIVRIATAEGTSGPRITSRGASISNAAFFALHYGLFTFVHGVFTLIIVAFTGLTGGVGTVLLLAGAITVAHLADLGLVWFGRGQRMVVGPTAAMVAPYPRMVALHVAIIGGFFFLLGGPDGDGRLGSAVGETAGVAILCGVKTLVDLSFLIRRGAPRVEDTDSLYGTA